MDVLFEDSAAADLHTAISGTGPISGIYQPGARNVDPPVVLDTRLRTAFLVLFAGLDPNGDWTLFIAETSPGGTAVLQTWGLKITGIPEPSACLLVHGSVALVLRPRQ